MSTSETGKKWLGVNPWIIISGGIVLILIILVFLFVPMFSSTKVVKVTETVIVTVQKQVPETVTIDVPTKVYVGYLQEQGQTYGSQAGRTIIVGQGQTWGVGASADRGPAYAPFGYNYVPGRRYQVDASDEIVDLQQARGPDGSLTITLTNAQGKSTVYRYIDQYDLTKTGQIKIATTVNRMKTVSEQEPRQITKQQVIPIRVNLIQLLTNAPKEPVKAWGAMVSGTENHLNSVWGKSSSDVFAVGSNGTIRHYNGKSWYVMASGTTNGLTSVWGSSSSNVFAVGKNGTILHYDGKAWGIMTSGTTDDLWEIWGNSSSDVFAVGSNGIIRHYDGKAWGTITSGTQHHLNSIWSSSSSDVFIVGNNGTILRYDGKACGVMTSGTENQLTSVWGKSSSDVFAVGNKGTILHYDGKSWYVMTSGTTNFLTSVWGSSSSNVFAVGTNGTILHYDGKSWDVMTSGTTNWLLEVCGSSASDVFVVGEAGTILHYPTETAVTTEIDPQQQREIVIQFMKQAGAILKSWGQDVQPDDVSDLDSGDPSRMLSAVNRIKSKCDAKQRQISALVPPAGIPELAELKGAMLELTSYIISLYQQLGTAIQNRNVTQLEEWKAKTGQLSSHPSLGKIKALSESLRAKYNISDSDLE